MHWKSACQEIYRHTRQHNLGGHEEEITSSFPPPTIQEVTGVEPGAGELRDLQAYTAKEFRTEKSE